MHGYNPKKLTHPSFIRIKKTDFSRLRLQKYFFLFNYTKTSHENSTPALQQNYTHQPKIQSLLFHSILVFKQTICSSVTAKTNMKVIHLA
jgi:hypothetical protein